MSKFPVVNGNTLTLHTTTLPAMIKLVRNYELEQFCVRVLEDSIEVSFPITQKIEETIPGILHDARQRAEQGEGPHIA